MADADLRRDQLAWLIVSSALTLAPHLDHLPPLLAALSGLLLALRGLLAYRGEALPRRWLLPPLAVLLIGLVLVEYRMFFGKAPGVALLAGCLSLKLLETSQPRDARVVILLGFFLQLAQFFERQNPAIAALALMGTTASLGALLALEGQTEPAGARLKAAARLLLQGLPLMVVLFLLFPRIQGPLWSLPADSSAARTGLSDTMTPGAIAHLSRSDAIAFRASFSGERPAADELYWRGPVLTSFDGRSWRILRSPLDSRPGYPTQGVAYAYTLTLEAHDARWLLALDYPAPAPGLLFAGNLQLIAREPVKTRRQLDLVAYPHTPVGLNEDPRVLSQALELPPDFNPRSRDLGVRLARRAARPEDVPQAILAHMRGLGLSYTLDPPAPGRDDVDGFLFDTRQGFCEHFSAAFVVLARAAGIPARVVTGYQGGQLNPFDGTLVVRQSDAHAWAEVWLAGRGWLRIDPTAASAPRRIDGGLGAALPDSAQLPLLARADLAWLRTLRSGVDALNHRWNHWVLGYNPARQREFLAGLGLDAPDWKTVSALMAVVCGVVMTLLSLWALRRGRTGDRLDRDWASLGRRLAGIGFPRQPWEGPMDYMQRVGAARPELAAALHALAHDYARLRYGPGPSDPTLEKRFQHAVHTFRPQ